MQAVCGLMLAQWTFDPTPASTTVPAASTANVTATSITGGGITSLGFQTSGAHFGNAWAGSSWSQNSIPSSFFEFDVSTVGYDDISMSFWASRSTNGPQNVSVQYSTDGSTFTQFSTYPVGTSVAQISIDLSSITSLDNNPNAKFRIYGINATTGTLRIDDVTFTGCLVVTIDSFVPNPTNSGSTISWHSVVNGSYELRLGGTDCTDGTVIYTDSYLTSPNTVSYSISAGDLSDGPNTVRICVTDATSFIHSVVGTLTKDTIAPSLLSFTRQSPAATTTNADTLTLRATFSEAVTNIDINDFVATGTTATPTAVSTVSASVYDVTISGGDLPSLNGSVGLNLNLSQNITDLATNSLPAGEPPVDETYTVNNTITPATNVVISEFRTRGPGGADDEYIELYNPTSTVIDISGWKINVSNDTGTISTGATIPSSTILRSGQYYLIAHSGTGGYSGIVSANLTYGQSITNAGGIALVKPDNTIVDQVGLGAGSAYKEMTVLSPLPSNTNQSYERKLGGAFDSCQDTGDNVNDFSLITPSDPKNYSSQLSRCGTLLSIPAFTTTTITADSPDPSLVNANVLVGVKVTGGSIAPTGQVNITGANTNCTITLNSSGIGSCYVVFSSTGVKNLTATYLGSQTYLSSSDTEIHQVSTTIRTPTPVPQLPPPPPPLLAINEFVPRPGHDWNNDGFINTGDEYIELINHGVVDINLSGYRLDDEANIGSRVYTLPSVILKPGERIVLYGSQTNLLLSDGGDGVRLLKSNGQLVDAYNYFTVNFPDQAFCRLPDNGGLDDWNTNCYPTPGLRNSLSGSILRPPTQNNEDEPLCPIADMLPKEFILAECSAFGHNIWNRYYWDKFGWYGEMSLTNVNGRWDVFAE